MVTEAEALAIANRAAEAVGWGRIDGSSYAVTRSSMEGQDVWRIGRREPVIGHSLTFIVSCADGAILFKQRRGPR